MLTVVSARLPYYSTPENKSIMLLVTFEEHADEMLFNAHPDDIEDHGTNLYRRALRGDFGPIAESKITPEEYLLKIKADLIKRFSAMCDKAHRRDPEPHSPLYLHKLEEARRVVKERSPKDEDFPLLLTMVGEGASDILDAGKKLLQRDTVWRSRAAEIERARIAGKTCINAATDLAHARSVFESLVV